MGRISKEKCESLNFYKYLCQKTGSKEVVRIRRLNLDVVEMGFNNKLKVIHSGNKAEGLDLKGSDEDIMSINSLYKVYPSETEVVFDSLTIPLIMNTDETLPCFAQLRLLDEQKAFKYMWENNNLGGRFSSELFRLDHLSLFPYEMKIHGPCLSDMNDLLDVAFCLKCDQWIFQARTWVSRPRSPWPSPKIISKIISCGVDMNKEKLATLLEQLYEQGVNCFASSETLQDYQGQFYKLAESFISGNPRSVQDTKFDIQDIKKINLLHKCLRHSRTGLSRGLFALYISKVCRSAPDTAKYQYSLENKQQYSKYKYDLIHLLIGIHSDAISGWLTLASFFYVHKNYFASLSVMKYALQKYPERKKTGRTLPEYAFIQRHDLNIIKKEKLYTELKAITIDNLIFRKNSSIIPKELQLDVSKSHAIYDPLSFAYFLNFLCYYHLQDMTSCRYYLQKLRSTINLTTVGKQTHLSSPIFCGIAYQLMGDTYVARQFFQQTAKFDSHNVTSAVQRLSSVI
ncbi:unnamed protein product [Mytilus coruscus]|uniref:Uncharacterized protein n=1 Tax=Mytilus coruscus TaxID=42192 RepID=A0A6J8DYA5_MYTCO|nr:unnamed protein product [Mytilus coruscus]